MATAPEPDYLHQAKAAAALAEARKFDTETKAIEFGLGELKRDVSEKLAANRYHHVYNFTAVVSESSVKNAMAQIDIWRRLAPGCDITIVFNSPGGDVVDGMAFWDYLQATKRAGHHLTTISYGYAASMAGILLQAGTTRILGKESWLMIHEASFAAHGKTGEVEDTVDWVKRVQDRILDIFAERSTHSRSAIKRKWTRKDWWLSSEDALDWGFVDEVH